MGALRAQGNIDKVMEWSSKTGFMINLMDRRVCLAVFHAAELKAEAQGAGTVRAEARPCPARLEQKARNAQGEQGAPCAVVLSCGWSAVRPNRSCLILLVSCFSLFRVSRSASSFKEGRAKQWSAHRAFVQLSNLSSGERGVNSASVWMPLPTAHPARAKVPVAHPVPDALLPYRHYRCIIPKICRVCLPRTLSELFCWNAE